MSKNEGMTITEFVEARITEDEREANVCLASPEHSTRRWTRVLAESKAKRAIVADRARIDRSANDDEWSMGYSDANYAALQAIASIYSDHRDYREEWAR